MPRKLIKLRLTLNVDIDPQGEDQLAVERRLIQVVRDAVNNGTLTGDGPSTVEHYGFRITNREKGKSCNT